MSWMYKKSVKIFFCLRNWGGGEREGEEEIYQSKDIVCEDVDGRDYIVHEVHSFQNQEDKRDT